MIPEALANDVRVEFDYFIDDRPHQIPVCSGHSRNPKFDYSKTFVQDPVTSRFLEYLKTKTMVFRVYGRDTQAERVHTIRTTSRPLTTTAPPTNGAQLTNGSTQPLSFAEMSQSMNKSEPAVPQQNSATLAPELAVPVEASPAANSGASPAAQADAKPQSPPAEEAEKPPSGDQVVEDSSVAAPSPVASSPLPPLAEPPKAPETPKAPSVSQIRREQEKVAQAQEQQAPQAKPGSKACQIL